MSAEVQRVVHGEGATMVVIMEMNSGDGMTASRHGCEADWRGDLEEKKTKKKEREKRKNKGRPWKGMEVARGSGERKAGGVGPHVVLSDGFLGVGSRFSFVYYYYYYSFGHLGRAPKWAAKPILGVHKLTKFAL